MKRSYFPVHQIAVILYVFIGRSLSRGIKATTRVGQSRSIGPPNNDLVRFRARSCTHRTEDCPVRFTVSFVILCCLRSRNF